MFTYINNFALESHILDQMYGYREKNVIKEVKDIEESLSNEFTDEDIVRTLEAACEQSPSPSNTFQYALCLRQDHNTSRKEKAIALLKTLTNNETFSRDAFYYIALTYYSLRDYRSALFFCEELYRYEPDNTQIKTLHAAVMYKFEEKSLEKAQDDSLKLGVGIGVLALGLGVAVAMIRKK